MKILFIGNDASRTGAPIGLLHLMHWLRGQPGVEFELLLRRSGGSLQADYARLCPVLGYDTLYSDRGPLRRAARRVGMRRLAGRSCLSPVEEYYRERGVRVVYANTIVTGGLVADLARLGCPAIGHVHELQSTIDASGPRNLAHWRRHIAHHLADSQATRRNLLRLGFPADRVSVAYEFIVADAAPPPGDRVARRAVLGIPAHAFVVGGCGFRYHRKGKDLFVRLARLLSARIPEHDPHFIWVGGDANDDDARRLRQDIAQAGMTDRVHVIPHVDDPFACYAAFDVLAMVSREEPFGMVMLEAACYACPTLCFRDVGGPEEFVEHDAGCVVPHLDVEAMAAAASELARDPERRRTLGARARAKMRERHDVSVVAPRILDAVRCVAARRPVVADVPAEA